jgi:hypothetical protein
MKSVQNQQKMQNQWQIIATKRRRACLKNMRRIFYLLYGYVKDKYPCKMDTVTCFD